MISIYDGLPSFLLYLKGLVSVMIPSSCKTYCSNNYLHFLAFQGDVIVSFDGIHIGSEGTVPFRSTERIAFRYLISQK